MPPINYLLPSAIPIPLRRPLTSITLPIQIMITGLIPRLPLPKLPQPGVTQPHRVKRRVITLPATLAVRPHVERALQPMIRANTPIVEVRVVVALPAGGDRVLAVAAPVLPGAHVHAGDGGAALQAGGVGGAGLREQGAGGGAEDGRVGVVGEGGDVVGLDGVEEGAGGGGGDGEGEEGGDGDQAEFGEHFGLSAVAGTRHGTRL